jgi:putative membrane protein (TIGR04086 family)
MIYQNDRRFIFMKKAVSAKDISEKNLFICSLRGLCVAAATALLLAAVTCAIGISLPEPDKYTKIFAMASLFFASFAGGFATARAKGCRTLLCGLCTAIMIAGTISLISLALSLPLNTSLFGICAPCITAVCILGANIGVGSGHVSKRKKR